MEKIHRYNVSNWLNEYSGQRYPLSVNRVEYEPITSKKYPDGMLLVSIEDVDGHCCSLLKAYKNKKGQRYCIWGGHRLYEGYHGPVMLVGVPWSMQRSLEECGAIIEGGAIAAD